MEVLTLENRIKTPSAIALGYFDAVHIGHLKVINNALSLAKQKGLLPCIFCFTDDKKLLKNKDGAKDIYTKEKRLELFSLLGAKCVIMPDFSQFSSLSPEDFAQILCKRYNADALCVGEDFKFGKNAAGDAKMLSSLCKKYGAEVIVEPKLKLNGSAISSTEIKKCLLGGDVEAANKMLGRYYSLSGEIIGGKHIGSKELFPTINQKQNENCILLKSGVYATVAKIDDKLFAAVSNIGNCPTVCENGETAIETHLIGCDVRLYGKVAEVFFVKRLRDETKFENTLLLKEQIKKDIQTAKTICEEAVIKCPLW